MIERVVYKADLKDPKLARRDLEYWLSKSPSERIAQIERLRRHQHGDLLPMSRSPDAVTCVQQA